MSRVFVASAAAYEIADALRSYEMTRPGLGRLFVDQVDRTLVQVGNYPEAAPTVSPGFRRAVVHQFPYCIIYRLHANDVQVLAVFPTRADPARLLSRLASTATP